MSKFVVVVTNNEGGQGATVHNTLNEAKEAVRRYLTDPDNDPIITASEQKRMESELAMADGTFTHPIQGSEVWKEWLYIAPILDDWK